MKTLDPKWDIGKRRSETELLTQLRETASLSDQSRSAIVARATELVERIRNGARPGLMEVFLAEYGLSTREGVALMCLAEALLRVPDAETIDALIEDKVASSDWSAHIGQSSSPLVNASTWGLLLTGKILDDPDPGVAGTLRSMIRRVGEPVIRTAVARAMREMGRQFVLGETIDAAMDRARFKEAEGFTYSYDMLGEAAMTAKDAEKFASSYADAIARIARACDADRIADNPGISIKLSALHPRYEVSQSERVIAELVPVVTQLARQASDAGMGLNIDAEEADRLGVSMAVIERVIKDPKLQNWDGFGVVVQAYGRRAATVIDGLYDLARNHRRRIMVRLVKGAYWDTEIKHAQVAGLTDFPVYTQKAATDISYIANARLLMKRTDRIYPQFATHNAHTVAAILEMATDLDSTAYEFQRLHGMGEALHDMVHKDEGTRCRIYAPVGAHRDLLAYLVRRLLENGANSSFVNQIVDTDVPAEEVAACPFDQLIAERRIPTGPEIYAPERINSKGFDLQDVTELETIIQARTRPFGWSLGPLVAGPVDGGVRVTSINPATGRETGSVQSASRKDVETALAAALPWQARVEERRAVLERAAGLYETNAHDLFALLATEAGKTLTDAVSELREAVDFLRFYASRAAGQPGNARGVFCCISPWNFPLAIFTGQVAAALATGNAVVAKPAETTPAIAHMAVTLLREAGVPETVLQLLPGEGATIGAALTSDPRIAGVAFTGSTATAKRIQVSMAGGGNPGAPLIAETGGLNAMIVDSTALPEQAVRDIIQSAFQSAGQRCSALRCLYVQRDIAGPLIEMVKGAMDELNVGDPWDIATDIGPVITEAAKKEISSYVSARADRVLHRIQVSDTGNFAAPTLISVEGIQSLEKEVFGPVLHVATYEAHELGTVIHDINRSGYGLTFGIHSRIDDRIQEVSDRIVAGNVYANRNQIGAVVGSQPFGGEGLSGTGPKAGGPTYLGRFTKIAVSDKDEITGPTFDISHLNGLLRTARRQKGYVRVDHLPGPTGELNRLSQFARDPILCLGPDTGAQKEAIEALGGIALEVRGRVPAELLETIDGIGGVLWWGGEYLARDYAKALARRSGPILPLITDMPDAGHALIERHLCVDTTAAGGNALLLAGRA